MEVQICADSKYSDTCSDLSHKGCIREALTNCLRCLLSLYSSSLHLAKHRAGSSDVAVEMAQQLQKFRFAAETILLQNLRY